MIHKQIVKQIIGSRHKKLVSIPAYDLTSDYTTWFQTKWNLHNITYYYNYMLYFFKKQFKF